MLLPTYNYLISLSNIVFFNKVGRVGHGSRYIYIFIPIFTFDHISVPTFLLIEIYIYFYIYIYIYTCKEH